MRRSITVCHRPTVFCVRILESPLSNWRRRYASKRQNIICARPISRSNILQRSSDFVKPRPSIAFLRHRRGSLPRNTAEKTKTNRFKKSCLPSHPMGDSSFLLSVKKVLWGNVCTGSRATRRFIGVKQVQTLSNHAKVALFLFVKLHKNEEFLKDCQKNQQFLLKKRGNSDIITSPYFLKGETVIKRLAKEVLRACDPTISMPSKWITRLCGFVS